MGVDVTGKDTGVSPGGLVGGDNQHTGDMSDNLGSTLSCSDLVRSAADTDAALAAG